MSNANVSTIRTPVNASLDDVRNWVTAMGERGIYSGEKARQRVTALNQLESILAADESRAASSVLDDLKSIATRWAVKNNGNPGTAQAYESRARGALGDYLNYLSNPTGFSAKPPRDKARGGEAGASKKPARATATSKADTKATHVTPPPSDARPVELPRAPQPVVQPAAPRLHECPLGKDREPFRYQLPAEGLVMADVLRIAMHLAAGAHDFDPMSRVVVQPLYPKLHE